MSSVIPALSDDLVDKIFEYKEIPYEQLVANKNRILKKYKSGLLSYVCSDNRIRTKIFQTKETGRFSSSDPPLQNLSKRREEDIKKIFGSEYKYPIRAMFRNSPGYVFLKRDYSGAELFMAGVQANDKVLIEHCRRSALPENHPDHFDLHSYIAIQAFKLTIPNREAIEKACKDLGKNPAAIKLKPGDLVPPSKTWMKACGYGKYRDIEKTIIFGLFYGRGNAAVIRSLQEEGTIISFDDAIKIRNYIFETYKRIQPLIAECGERVINPGWLANWTGRLRRFGKINPKTLNEETIEKFKREAANFIIQGGVADLVSLVLEKLFYNPNRIDEKGLRYKIILQLHDEVILEVREDCAEEVNKEVQNIMHNIPVYSANLNGQIIDDTPYYFHTDGNFFYHWGLSSEKR